MRAMLACFEVDILPLGYGLNCYLLYIWVNDAKLSVVYQRRDTTLPQKVHGG